MDLGREGERTTFGLDPTPANHVELTSPARDGAVLIDGQVDTMVPPTKEFKRRPVASILPAGTSGPDFEGSRPFWKITSVVRWRSPASADSAWIGYCGRDENGSSGRAWISIAAGVRGDGLAIGIWTSGNADLSSP
jgi:hypothetical protein